MTWDIEFTDEFGDWFKGLTEVEQDKITAVVDMLEVAGPRLGFPQSSDVRKTKMRHMRELRIQIKGEPYRVLYAFDPRRTAILLLGGNKARIGDRWYEENIPRAERLYREHLETLRREGLIDGNKD